MTNLSLTFLQQIMEEAISRCIKHVEQNGLPFVGVVVNESGIISNFGVNQVQETGDPTAHAEIVAMRDAMASFDRQELSNAVLLATGEPCGLCYQFAHQHGIREIYVAVDRDQVAQWGIDYRDSYTAFGISDEMRNSIYRLLPVMNRTKPFAQYLKLALSLKTPKFHQSER